MTSERIVLNLATESLAHLRRYAESRNESVEAYLERWAGTLAQSPIDEQLDRIKSIPITDPDPLLVWWDRARKTDMTLPLRGWLLCTTCGTVAWFEATGPLPCRACSVTAARLPFFLHHSYDRLISAMIHCAPGSAFTLDAMDDPYYKRGTVGMLATVLFSTLNERLLEQYLVVGFTLTDIRPSHAQLLLEEFDSVSKRVQKLVPLVAGATLATVSEGLHLQDGRRGTEIVRMARSVAEQRNAFLHEAKEPFDWALPLKCMKEVPSLLEFYVLLHNATLSKAALSGRQSQ